MVSIRRHFVLNPVFPSRADFRAKCKTPLPLHTRYDNDNNLLWAEDNSALSGYQVQDTSAYDALGRMTATTEYIYDAPRCWGWQDSLTYTYGDDDGYVSSLSANEGGGIDPYGRISRRHDRVRQRLLL